MPTIQETMQDAEARSLPSEVVQLPHATVIYSRKFSPATGRIMPKLYVQAMDAYRYQREWTIGLRHEPGDSSKLYWESHAYRHPGMRHEMQVTQGTAKRLIERFLHLCREYPELILNADHPVSTPDHPATRVRHERFVHFHDCLLAGSAPSVRLLALFA